MPRRAATSSSRPRGQIQSDGSSNTVTPVDTVSQYAVRGRNPPCEQFEDIQVNGETIRISKGGRRRYYHNLAIAFIKNCRHCFKMVCYCQHLLINKGFYMLDDEDNEEERLKSLHLYNDDEIIQKIVNGMSMFRVLL
jgi:hypothetical protein